MTPVQARLQLLYDIGKVLARFESVEQALPEVLGLVNEVTPLRTAVLMLDERTEPFARTRAFVWHAEGVGLARAEKAESHATQAYSYLSRGIRTFQHSTGTTRFPTPMPPPPETALASFVVLPLVVDRGRVFGALQLEGARRLTESDLGFVNATVNQLGVALDRVAAVAERQAVAAAAQVAAELVAQASGVLFSSLDYEATVAAVVRAPVPALADICVFDELLEDGRIRRGVHVGDPHWHAEVIDRIRALVPRADSALPQIEVLRSGAAVVLHSLESFAGEPEHLELLRGLGVHSVIVVRLTARGHALGALTFAATASDRPYGARELALAKEIGLRASLAMDNARLYADAQRATQARQHLIAIVSHDLKNPLATIVMSGELLLSPKTTADAEALRKRVDVILRSARRMTRLLADLLDITSIEMGRLSVAKQRHDGSRIVAEAIDLHAPAAADKGVRLEGSGEVEEFEVDCDRDRVLQILGNLIGNAIKFTPRGGAVSVSGRPLPGQVRFSVADTGPGIAPEEVSYVFDRYWQSQKTASLGTGLGLSISKGLVELHGGRIWVEPTPGGGVTFAFTIPTAPRLGETPRVPTR